MSEKTYPPFRTSKEIDVRFAPQFGQPTFSTDNNDTFEGTEQCAWNIQFQNGSAVVISENRGFGASDSHYEKSTSWKVNSRDTNTYTWIKEAIRDSNPNG
jgi:hypothetical protein